VAGEENFLSRWSRRKTESREASQAEPAVPEKAAAVPAAAPEAPPVEREPLPALESLTPESDFAPFMAADVDGDVRRQALKTLFSDPHFNTMDMMDVYVDDYSKPDPLPESWLAKLEQVSRLGDRAGRDREEAERREALARAQAEARVPAEKDETAAGTVGDETASPGAAPSLAGEAGRAGESPVPTPPIPTLPAGESGA
jgi:hypothetical protein